MVKKCPVCAAQLIEPLPAYCERCAWDINHDITLLPSLHQAPECIAKGYYQRLNIAKSVWQRSIVADQGKPQNSIQEKASKGAKTKTKSPESIDPLAIWADIRDVVVYINHQLAAKDPLVRQELNAVFQYELTGENGRTFHIPVVNGIASLVNGAHTRPDITIASKTSDFISILKGNLDACSAYAAGIIKVNGDKALQARLKGLLGQLP